jgi:hypothetical protein
MPKAVLIMDMPGSCFGCNFCHINSSGREDRCQAFEVSRAVNSETYEKPDWCPLRELPEKIPELKSGYEEISKSIHRDGWNACLDEILGGKDDGTTV